MPQHVSLPRLVPRSFIRGMDARTPPGRIQTGLDRFDRLLGGGLPRGVVTEIVGAPSSGRTTLAYAALAAVTMVGGFVACIDLPDAFDPEHAGAAGIDLARVLWIRPRDPRVAFHAAEHVVGAGGFGLVLIDLDVAYTPSTRVSVGTWLRLARAAERSQSAVVVVNVCRSEQACATLRLETERRRTGFTTGGDRPCPLFDGIISAVHLRKNKLGSPTVTPISLFAAITA